MKHRTHSSATRPDPPARLRPTALRKDDIRYWEARLVHRKYLELCAPAIALHYSTRIDYGGTSCYFPLGSSNPARAAARAQQIHRTLNQHGWQAAVRRYPREFTLALFWNDNPLLCTYTTLLTQPRTMPRKQPHPPLPTQPRVMIAEPDEQVRRTLNSWYGSASTPACADPHEAVAALRRNPPDLVLLNRSLTDASPPHRPGEGPLAGCSQPVIGFGVYETSDDIFVSHTGVSHGYFLHRTAPHHLLDPIRGASAGTSAEVTPAQLQIRKYFQNLVANAPREGDPAGHSTLTTREEEILLRLGKGYPDKQIAAALNISTWTVHNHMKNIFRKLGVHTRTQAVIKYLQR